MERDDLGHFAEGNKCSPPGKLTAERHGRIVELVGKGNFLSTAARGAGIDARTLKTWLHRGEQDRAAERETDHARLYADVREAVSDSETRLVETIRRAAHDGFTLTRKHTTTTRDVEGKVTGTVEHVEETGVGPDWRAAARLLEARASSRFGRAAQLEVKGGLVHRHGFEITDEDRAIAERICNRRLSAAYVPTDGAIVLQDRPETTRNGQAGGGGLLPEPGSR